MLHWCARTRLRWRHRSRFSLDQLLRQTDDNLIKGFRAIKMKVGWPRLSEDLERVRAMREHLGADFPLMVDANMRWSVDEAVRAARGLSGFGVYWLEEPTIPDDVEGHRRIVRDGGLPIATGENLHTLYEFKQMIASGGVTFPEADVTNCGGVTAFIKIAHMAEAFNLPITSHGAHDITIQLLAALPNRSYLEVHGFGLERFLTHPLDLQTGSRRRRSGRDTASSSIGRDWKWCGRVDDLSRRYSATMATLIAFRRMRQTPSSWRLRSMNRGMWVEKYYQEPARLAAHLPFWMFI